MTSPRNYEARLGRLIERRTAAVPIRKSITANAQADRDFYTASPIYEVYNHVEQDGKAVRYAIGAMQRVDPGYTDITYEQGSRIKNQLTKAFARDNIRCVYRYQGSVTSDTHIKVYSDIDLLAITENFLWLEPPQVPTSPYLGDPVRDVEEIRTTSLNCLETSFPAASVDGSGGKSISIDGGSLRRKVDVVPASWQDTNAYAASAAERDRAIKIYCVATGKWIVNKPFLHSHLLRTKDRAVLGGLRKIIRLMKSLRYDSDGAVKLSSFDIAGIAYAMHRHQLLVTSETQLALLPRLKEHLDFLAASPDARNQLYVPDESRRVFCKGHATLEKLDAMRDEVDDLVEAIAKDLDRSFSKLGDARLAFRPRERWAPQVSPFYGSPTRVF